MTLPDTLWDDPNYRARISLLAAKVNNNVASRAEADEYRAHIVVFRIADGMSEEMAERAIRRADNCPGAFVPGIAPPHT